MTPTKLARTIQSLTPAQRHVLLRARIVRVGASITQDLRIGKALIKKGIVKGCGRWEQVRRSLGYFGRKYYYDRHYFHDFCLTEDGVQVVETLQATKKAKAKLLR